MVFIKTDQRSWLNLIKRAWNSHLWINKESFKAALFEIVLANKTYPHQKSSLPGKLTPDEVGKKKISRLINQSKPHQWFPEIIEAFFSRFEASSTGAFYTPQACCELLAEIALLYVAKPNPTVYDPACGCGSLLYALGLKRPSAKLYGQELSRESVNNARFFLAPWSNKIKETNTLYQNRLQRTFDIVLCNPPFNLSLEQAVYGTSDGNTAWVRHCLASTSLNKQEQGITLIILSSTVIHGEKFKECRQELIRKNQLEAVVLLPNKIFANTFVEVCLLVLRKKRLSNAPILLLDASNYGMEIENSSRKNLLKEEILADYQAQKGLLASRKQIIAQAYNLTFNLYRPDNKIGTPVQDLFDHCWVGDNEQKALTLPHTALEIKGSLFSNFTKKMLIIAKGTVINQKVLYLWAKDFDENKLVKLREYLLNNLAEVKSFYTGSIIKHLQKDNFLKYFKIVL